MSAGSVPIYSRIEQPCVPCASYVSFALSCCRLNFAHFANSSWADVAFISRLRRTTSPRNLARSADSDESEPGSFVKMSHNVSLIVCLPIVLIMWIMTWSEKARSSGEIIVERCSVCVGVLGRIDVCCHKKVGEDVALSIRSFG